MLTIQLRLKGKLEKNLTIRMVFLGKGTNTKLGKNLAYASFILCKENLKDNISKSKNYYINQ